MFSMKISAFVVIAFTLCILSNYMEVDGANAGKPPCQILCPLNFDPICGTDGVTYSNQCFLDGKNRCDGTNIGKAYDGECKAYY